MGDSVAGPEGPRAYIITDTDQRGIIVIVATLLMSWMVLCFLVRMFLRLSINGPFGWDDLNTGIATVFGIAHVGVLLKSVTQGLGKSRELLSTSSSEAAQKGLYTSDILFVLGHTFAKLAVVYLLRRLGRDSFYRRVCHIVAGVVSAWGIASVIATSVKCNASEPWLISDECSHVTTRWQAVTALDVITESVFIALALYLVWGLQMSWGRKAVVIGAFGSRIPVIVISIVRVTYINELVGSEDPTLAISDTLVCTEILLHYSVMAATIPCLKPFVIAFNTGWGQGNQATGNSYLQQTAPGSDSKSRFTSSKASNKHTSLTKPDFRGDITHATVAGATRGSERACSEDAPTSIDSNESQQMIIRETRGWAVEHDGYELEELNITKNDAQRIERHD